MKKDITELHNLLLDLAISFDKICRDNAIPYYMLGGTMLGAIRHNGFIPWDDDMDFGVPREYYNKLVGILSESLPDFMAVRHIGNSEYIISGFIKIEDTRTYIREKYRKTDGSNIGVNIDIFPLDTVDNIEKHVFSKNWKVEKLLKVQNFLFLSSESRSFLKKYFALIMQFLNPFEKTSIINYIEKIISKRATDSDSYVANIYGAWGMKEIVNKNIMGTPVIYQFENIELYGVEDHDRYLRALYGNYMEIPPENKRHIHIDDFGLKDLSGLL